MAIKIGNLVIYNNDDKPVYVKITKVIDCETCKGTGYTSHEQLTDYHKREYSTFTNLCHKCKGDGRLVEIHEEIILPCDIKHTTKIPFSEFKEKELLPYHYHCEKIS